MAKLILTQEEKDADLWSDFDDDALGKVCRNMMIKQQADGMGRDQNDGIGKGKGDPAAVEFWQLAGVNAAKVLISNAEAANADHLKMSFKGLTVGDSDLGDWTISIDRGYNPDEPDDDETDLEEIKAQAWQEGHEAGYTDATERVEAEKGGDK
jgi:hypothetical protein